MQTRVFFAAIVFAAAIVSNASVSNARAFAEKPASETATFGGGCYWCVEAVFQRINGVASVSPGFMGGRTKNPNYAQVLTGRTGHVEVIQIEFDSSVVSYDTLLQVFFRTHDPTTLNRQGPDTGTQYRSVIFCHTKEQEATAKEYKKLLMRQKAFRARIVTAIEQADTFYRTDQDHSNYFNRNKQNPFCVANIVPKLEKLRKEFGDHLNSDEDE